LRHHLRFGAEGQEVSELAGGTADLLTKSPVSERAAKSAAERPGELAKEVAEQALRHHLRVSAEGKIMRELAGGSADLLAESLIAEGASDGTSERAGELAKEVPPQALWHELLR
jgi:hypothetical protein